MNQRIGPDSLAEPNESRGKSLSKVRIRCKGRNAHHRMANKIIIGGGRCEGVVLKKDMPIDFSLGWNYKIQRVHNTIV